MLDHLLELRTADRKTRVRWVVILSAACSLIVIVVWMFGLSVVTSTIAEQEYSNDTSLHVRGATGRLKDAFAELKLRTSNAFTYFSTLATQEEILLTESETTSSTQTQ